MLTHPLVDLARTILRATIVASATPAWMAIHLVLLVSLGALIVAAPARYQSTFVVDVPADNGPGTSHTAILANVRSESTSEFRNEQTGTTSLSGAPLSSATVTTTHAPRIHAVTQGWPDLKKLKKDLEKDMRKVVAEIQLTAEPELGGLYPERRLDWLMPLRRVLRRYRNDHELHAIQRKWCSLVYRPRRHRHNHELHQGRYYYRLRSRNRCRPSGARRSTGTQPRTLLMNHMWKARSISANVSARS